MAQIDIKKVAIFKFDEYTSDFDVVPTSIGSAEKIINPKLTVKENKSDQFFALKPRRFEFSVDKSENAWAVTESIMQTPHDNFSDLTNYMVRAYDSTMTVIFEGIISVMGEFEYNKDIVKIVAYDPIVLFSDSLDRLRAADLQLYYTDPHAFQVILFDTAINEYFLTSTYRPSYDTSWSLPDWGLGDYSDVYDWGTAITQFYSDITVTHRIAATQYMIDNGGSLTDVYDFSKLEVTRDFIAIRYRVNFDFIGCIVFYDSSNNNSYTVFYVKSGYNAFGNPLFVGDNDTIYSNYYNPAVPYSQTSGNIQSYTVMVGQFGTRNIVFDNSLFPSHLMGNPLLYSFQYFPKDYKSQVHAKDYPQWRSLTDHADYKEAVDGMAQTDIANVTQKGDMYVEEFGLRDEGGNLITNVNSSNEEADYLYVVNDATIFYGYDYNDGANPPPKAITQTSDWEDGIFDLTTHDSTDTITSAFKFHINYGNAYPLVYTDFPTLAGSGNLHKVGNISRLIGYLPDDVTFAPVDGGTDYNFDTTDSNKYWNFADLLKFFLASMNLTVNYNNGNYNIIKAFYMDSSAIVIADADVIDWKTKTTNLVLVDTTSVLKPTLNYVGNALNPYYNEAAALDNQQATCKINRVKTDYDLELNSKLTIMSDTWKIDKIDDSNIADYDVTLTKYTYEPTP